jgi:pyruvate/2-oxoglutarate dehydrogenase complex dihydrolipoamide acyltransferase (E2) component
MVPIQALPIPAAGKRITERDVKSAAAAYASIEISPEARRLACEKGLDAAQLSRIANGRRLELQDIRKLAAVPLRLPAERVAMTAEERAEVERVCAATREVPSISVSVFVPSQSVRQAELLPRLVLSVGSLLGEDEFKHFRAIVDGSDWVYRGQINVGVALEDGSTAIIHNADRAGEAEVASVLSAGQVSSGQCTGAIVTVYPLERLGLEGLTVRPENGEAGVLTLSPPQLKPISKDNISVGLSLRRGSTLTLTVDQRLVSKKMARIFVLRLKSLLENASDLI